MPHEAPSLWPLAMTLWLVAAARRGARFERLAEPARTQAVRRARSLAERPQAPPPAPPQPAR